MLADANNCVLAELYWEFWHVLDSEELGLAEWKYDHQVCHFLNVGKVLGCYKGGKVDHQNINRDFSSLYHARAMDNNCLVWFVPKR